MCASSTLLSLLMDEAFLLQTARDGEGGRGRHGDEAKGNRQKLKKQTLIFKQERKAKKFGGKSPNEARDIGGDKDGQTQDKK